MENVIKEIKFKIDKKEFTLTAEQAKKFKNALDELFGKEVVKEIVREEHHHHDYPWPYTWHWHYSYPQYSMALAQELGRFSYNADSNTAMLALME